MLAKNKLAMLIHLAGLAIIAPAAAQQVTFTFDNAPIHTSLPITQTVSGITAHLSATGQGFSIQEANAMGFTPAGFSGLVIYPNSVYQADLLVKFDTAITYFSIMYSCQELGCDDAATMRVTAYRSGILTGTNTKVAANPGTWPVDVLSCSFNQGFDSVVVHYDKRPPTCQDYGVIFLADNMRVTARQVLAVNLLYFNCYDSSNNAVLHWRTAHEVNFSHYVVEYAKDGHEFTNLATIKGTANNHDYSYTQNNVSGTTYYRLKMVTSDGSFTYSQVNKLVFGSLQGVTISPNPASGYITINGNIPGIQTVQVFSADGKVLKTINRYNAGQKIDIARLPKGAYIIKAFSFKNEVLFEKLFLKM